MAKRTDKSLVVGLDIGTSKIVAIVGEIQADGQVAVLGALVAYLVPIRGKAWDRSLAVGDGLEVSLNSPALSVQLSGPAIPPLLFNTLLLSVRLAGVSELVMVQTVTSPFSSVSVLPVS